MTTTLEKFEYVIGTIGRSQELVDAIDFPLATELILDSIEVRCSIIEDYADKLDEDRKSCVFDLFQAEDELKKALAEEKKSKRVAKLRVRKTGTGMSNDDFVLWAKGRSISSGTCTDMTKYTKVYFIRNRDDSQGALVLGGRCKQFVGYIDRSKVWRIVE